MSKLAEAKNLLITKGRTIGWLEDSDTGCLCPLGALALAYYGEADPYAEDEDGNFRSYAYDPEAEGHAEDLWALADVIRQRNEGLRGLPDTGTIFRFNDSYAKSDAEVLSVFDEAIAS